MHTDIVSNFLLPDFDENYIEYYYAFGENTIGVIKAFRAMGTHLQEKGIVYEIEL